MKLSTLVIPPLHNKCYNINSGTFSSARGSLSFAAVASKGLTSNGAFCCNNNSINGGSAVNSPSSSQSNVKYFQMAPTHASQIPWH